MNLYRRLAILLLHDLIRRVTKLKRVGGSITVKVPRTYKSKIRVTRIITPDVLVEEFCNSLAMPVVEAGLGLTAQDIYTRLLDESITRRTDQVRSCREKQN